jgi:hypothetical protein
MQAVGRNRYRESKPNEGNRVNGFPRTVDRKLERKQKEIGRGKKSSQETAQTFLIKAPGLRSTRGYIAIPGTGFRAGMGTGPLGVMALGFMGLGPGAGPRRGLPAWLAFGVGEPSVVRRRRDRETWNGVGRRRARCCWSDRGEDLAEERCCWIACEGLASAGMASAEATFGEGTVGGDRGRLGACSASSC